MAEYSIPLTQALCGHCDGAGHLRVPEEAERCPLGANGNLCDYEKGHPRLKGSAAHHTSLEEPSAFEALARAMWEHEMAWARVLLRRAQGAASDTLEGLAREIATRAFTEKRRAKAYEGHEGS